MSSQGFFIQQTSLPAPYWALHGREGAAPPGDRISPPAETGNKSNSFIGCVSSWQVVRKTYSTGKIRPLNSRREESSQSSPYPALLLLLPAFLLVTFERHYSTGRLCKHQGGRCQIATWRHQRGDQVGVLSTEGHAPLYALLGLLVPDVSWEQRVQRTNPREIKYPEGLILKEICWTY